MSSASPLIDEERILSRAHVLARACAGERVLGNHLAQVVTHLKTHRDPGATKTLVAALKGSVFALRTGSTRRQLEALARLVGPEIRRDRDWREAAAVVGWARRLLPHYGGRY